MTQKFIIACVLSLSLISCKKNTVLEGSIKNVLHEASAVSAEAVQQVYEEMSPQEKLTLWNEHFDFWKDSLRQEPEKVSEIVKLQNTLSVSIFIDDSDDQIVFLNYTGPEWVVQAKQKFSDRELFELTMQNKFAPPNLGELDGEDEPEDCFCHVGNNGYSCKKVTISLSPSVEYGVCEVGNKCKRSRRGCGFLWLESCNGSHCQF